MTPHQLRAACVRAGGVAALAKLIGKPRLYVQRRLTPSDRNRNEPYPVGLIDELAILKALNLDSIELLASESVE